MLVQEYRPPPTIARSTGDPDAKRRREEQDYFARARSRNTTMKVRGGRGGAYDLLGGGGIHNSSGV